MLVLMSSIVFFNFIASFEWEELRLPTEHIPYYFTNNPHLKHLCASDDSCPYKVSGTYLPVSRWINLSYCYILMYCKIKDCESYKKKNTICTLTEHVSVYLIALQ